MAKLTFGSVSTWPRKWVMIRCGLTASLVVRFAEVMKDRLKRGQLVFVEGELSFRKADNGTVYTNLMVDTCRILRDPRSAGAAGDGDEGVEFPF
tara:strand:+ start:18211 stop:18492 length:282 start_codon:yes stop_codon:yes gene_type:complete